MNRRLALVLAVGLVAGVAVRVLTTLLSNTDIGGATWTLRGNGALVVLFGGAAMLLTGGWAFLAQRPLDPTYDEGPGDARPQNRRSFARRVQLAGLAAVIALVLEIVFVFVPIALGANASPAAAIVLAIVVTILGVVAGIWLADGGGRTAALTVGAVTIVISVLPFGLQFLIVPLALPVLVAAPAIARHWSGRLGLESVGWLVAVAFGLRLGGVGG